MDTSKIEERLADLEYKSCCGRVKFYSASSPKPTIGVKKVLYIVAQATKQLKTEQIVAK